MRHAVSNVAHPALKNCATCARAGHRNVNGEVGVDALAGHDGANVMICIARAARRRIPTEKGANCIGTWNIATQCVSYHAKRASNETLARSMSRPRT